MREAECGCVSPISKKGGKLQFLMKGGDAHGKLLYVFVLYFVFPIIDSDECIYRLICSTCKNGT